MAGTREDLTGRRFSRLAVLESAGTHTGPNGQKQALWLCRCDCGADAVVRAPRLKDGRVKSCGCMKREQRKSPEERAATRSAWRKANLESVDGSVARYAAKEAKKRALGRKLRKPAAKAAARRYAEARALGLAVRGISDDVRPIDRGIEVPPLCACHHEPMLTTGKGWRCGPDHREANRRRDKEQKARDYDRWREQRRRSERRRRAYARGVKSEAYTREELFARDGGRCRYCDSLVDESWHVAHLVALARGGEDTLDNVAVACAACNLADGVGRLPVQLHLPRAA